MKLTEEQRNKLRRSIESDFGCVCLDSTLDHIEQIVSERITPEAGESVKPVPSIPIVGGWSVASDRTEPGESGQSAEEKALSALSFVRTYQTNNQIDWLKIYEDVVAGIVLHYASQVCADKEREIEELKIYEKAYAKMDEFSRAQCAKVERLESELYAANESLTVLEKEIGDCKKSMLSAGMISGKDAEKFKKRHNISIETIDLRKIENGYDINNPKTK